MTIEELYKISGCLADLINWETLSEFVSQSRKTMKKQIPAKPLEDKKFHGNGICPCCTVLFLDKSTKYCGNCGQALDWSDTE